MRPRGFLYAAGLMMGLACVASAAPADATGFTARIRQEMTVGKLNAATDYQAKFLGDRQFRVEGTMTLSSPKEQQSTLTIASDGLMVRQIEQGPDGRRAVTVDLERVHKAMPGYDPVLTYDPRAYRSLLTDGRAVSLGEGTLDGIAVTRYQADLPRGRLSLPANVALWLPEPAKVRFWLCPADGMVRHVELDDPNGATFLKVTYSDVRSGIAIDPNDFKLKFPESLAPRDITEALISMLSASRLPPATPEQQTRQKPSEAKPAEKATP